VTATGGTTGPAGASSFGLRERRRLERDLHDGAQQRLVSLALILRTAREKLEAEPGETARLLDRSRTELDQALRELRDLARGIHPAVLGDRGLGAAVEALAERAPLPVEVVSNLPHRRLPEQVELAAYFVVSEALTNTAKHAAAMKASVALTERDGWLTVEVRDDGAGGADLDRGTGLRGLADRVAAIDGRLEIDSKAGQGTIVRAGLPCPQPALELAPRTFFTPALRDEQRRCCLSGS
jgi:signal transduction histidine kinase